jgi:PIN domain nuclease of toxin-antitoxin system
MRKSRHAGSGNSVLLLDTNILVWAGVNEPRLPAKIRELLTESNQRLFVSAVTAWEFSELQARGRLPQQVKFAQAIESLSIELLDFPATAWPITETLPPIHRDPIDRMVIGHAIIAGLTLVTSDEKMRRYPVKTFW